MLGGPLSGYLMRRLAGHDGLAGWQWMFLCEGLASCALGVIPFFFLNDKPHDASWFTATEKQTLYDELLSTA